MPEAIRVSRAVVIPASALSFRAVRSSGPGGQNVNKVASKVVLRVDLSRILGLTAEQQARLHRQVQARFDANGLLHVTSQRTRDQGRNLEEAREKVRALVARALAQPRLRRPTRPSVASREKRLEAKRRASRRKSDRAAPLHDD